MADHHDTGLTWKDVEDPVERRRMQNRENQRAYRRRREKEREGRQKRRRIPSIDDSALSITVISPDDNYEKTCDMQGEERHEPNPMSTCEEPPDNLFASIDPVFLNGNENFTSSPTFPYKYDMHPFVGSPSLPPDPSWRPFDLEPAAMMFPCESPLYAASHQNPGHVAEPPEEHATVESLGEHTEHPTHMSSQEEYRFCQSAHELAAKRVPFTEAVKRMLAT